MLTISHTKLFLLALSLIMLKKKKSTKCPENITIVEGRTMDRNMEKEWTGVKCSELLFTAFIMISCFYLCFFVIVHGAYYIVKCTSLTDSTGKIKMHKTLMSLCHEPRILIIQVHAPEGLIKCLS